MKKTLLVLLSFLSLALTSTLSAQCLASSSVADVTLQCSSGYPNRSGLAFNPNQNLYYSVTSGGTFYPLETFTVTGGSVLTTSTQVGVNYRGYWWNSSTGKPEGNTGSSGGLYTTSLNASYYPTSSTSLVGSLGMPGIQSCGAFDAANNQIIYYDNFNIYKYSRTTGALVATVPVTGLPASSIMLYSVMFTGVPGREVGLFDYTAQKFYFVDYTTGAYVSSCSTSGSFTTNNNYGLAYANGRAFVFNPTTYQWIGFPISCPGAALDFDGGTDVATASGIGLNGQSFTIEFWAKQGTPGYHCVISQGSNAPSTNNGLQVGFEASNVFRFGFYNNDLVVTTPIVSDGLYHHWACVYKSGVTLGLNRFIYLDGLLISADRSTSDFLGSGTFYIGKNNPVSSYFFDGSIDELRIWGVARSQCDIQAYMNCEIPTSATSLLANYHFNQGVAGMANPTVTTITDASTNGHNAAMSTFSLTGSSSNWVAPGGVTSNSTTAAAISASISLTGNSIAITNGATGTSTNNFTDFGSASSRTFVIQNSAASGTLDISNISVLGSTEFSISLYPTSSLAPGASSAIWIAFTPTISGVRTGTISILSNDCGKPVFTFVVSGTAPSGEALSFDGNNDLARKTIFTSTTTNVTMQAKVNWRGNNGLNQMIVYNGGSASNGYGIYMSGGTGSLSLLFAGIANYPFNYTLTPNQWTSLSVVLKSGTAECYVNGVLTNIVGTSVPSVPTGSFTVGSNNTGTEIFNGSIDEVLFWTRALPACEIQTYLDCEIPTTGASLLANYHFNQGAAGISNSTVTTATDASGNNNTLILSNFALTGTLSNWVAPGGVVSGFTTTNPPTATLIVTGNSNAITAGSTSPLASNFTDFGTATSRVFTAKNTGTGPLYINNVTFSGLNAAQFSFSTSASNTINTAGSSTLAIIFTPTATGSSSAIVNILSSDCSNPTYSFVITASLSAAEALNFDGANDYAARPVISTATNNISMQAQVYMTAFKNPAPVFFYSGNTGLNGYGLIGGSGTGEVQLVIGGQLVAPTGYSVPLNQWVQLSLVLQNGRSTVYADGVQIYTQNTFTPATPTGSTILGANQANAQNFQGSMDEFRFWSRALSQCEIQSYMDCEIPTTGTNLTANYHFNQGIPSGTNTAIITATDVSGNGNNMFLTNFALTGATSNWVSPGGVTTGSSTPASITTTISLSGNGNSISNNATTTSATNLTNFNGATTRTFVVTNSGNGTLNIATPYFTGANATGFSVTTGPLSTTLLAGASTSFVVAFIPSTIGTYSAAININNNDCAKPLFNFVITATATAASALNFDGTSDYTARTETNFGLSDFSMEMWVKPTAFGVINDKYLITNRNFEFDGNGYWYTFALNGDGTLAFASGVCNLAGGFGISSPSPLTLNTWQHVAVTRKGTTYLLYINGLLVQSYSDPNGLRNFTSSGGSNTVNFGAWASLGGRYFTGGMDEVRIWSTARSQCEIQTYMNCEIPTSASGLVNNYHFNQGIPSGANTAVTTLTDAAGSSNPSLNGFNLTNGNSTSNWVSPGGVTNGTTTTTPPTASISLSGGGNSIANNLSTASTLNLTDFNGATTRTFVITNVNTGTLNAATVFFTGTSASEYSVTTLPATAVTAGNTTSFVVAFTPAATGVRTASVNINSNDCGKPLFSFIIQGTAPLASALNFDGTNDYAEAPHRAALALTNSLSIEAWVNPDVLTGLQYIASKGPDDQVNGNYGLLLNNNAPVLSLYQGGFHTATSSLTIATGVWSHIAGTWDGASLRVYVNGVLGGISAYSTPLGANTGSLEIGRLGKPSFLYQLNGSIDELRIWNDARSQCEIQTFMKAEITSTASGLVANFHFNQGAAGLANSTTTVLTESSASANATLSLFGLTGTASNWVAPGGVVNSFTTSSVPTSSLLVKGNSTNILNGATGTSTTNFTDFGGATTRTFVTTNATGTGTLYFNSVSLSGANAADFSVTTAPTATSITTGTGSFVITFNPLATGNRTAMVTVNSSDCTAPNYSFVITASTTPASALNFDGVDDYVNFPSSSFPSGNSDFTLEFWTKLKSTQTGQRWIAWWGNPGVSGQMISVGYDPGAGNKIRVHHYGPDLIATTAAIPLNVWTHVAVNYHGASNSNDIYINGNYIETLSFGGSFLSIPTAPQVQLGTYISVGTYASNIDLDEVRMWNTARNQCQVQTFMNAEITSTASGLVANWHFNQGIPSGPNTTVTTLTDAAGSNSGTLTNFSLTAGSVSNWISPGGVANGFTTTVAPAGNLIVTGNSATITAGSVVTSTTNFTDFGGASTRTFVAKNTAGSGTLCVNPVTISGGNAADFGVTTLPSASLTASGTSNFVITFNATAAGSRTAIVNVSSSDCTTPNYSFVITASGTPASALNFDGSSDYVQLAEPNFGTGDLTIEAWVKPAAFGSNQYLLTTRTNESTSSGNYWDFGYGTSANLYFEVAANGSAPYQSVSSATSTLTLNAWNHVAAVRSGTITNVYVNGELRASATTSALANLSTIASTMRISGSGSNAALFNGTMDEVRLWNVARTQCQIQTFMNAEITSTASGLIANYHFNQGLPSGTNTGVITLTTATGSNNGVLNTFALSGSTSNWVSPGGVVNDFTISAAPVASISLSGNGNGITYNSTATSTTNLTDFNGATTRTFVITNTGAGVLSTGTPFLSGVNASEFSITVLPASATLSAGASASFVVAFTPTAGSVRTATVSISNSDCSKPLFNFTIKGTAPFASALNFDGTSDFVQAPNISPLVLTNALSLEAWVKPNDNSNTYYVVSKGTNDLVNGQYGLVIINGTVQFHMYNSGHAGVASTSLITPGVWTHLAGTWDGTTMKLYFNGILNNTISYSTPLPATNNDLLQIGRLSSGGYWFNGSIDEVRIWNTGRTQCDIQQYMNAEIPTTASGLVANYHFNQGAAGLANPTTTLLTDASVNANTGTLNSFALTGATSNWVSPGGVVNDFTTSAAPTASISVSGNGNGITNNATSASTLNLTDFNGATTRNFVITNSNTGTLNVSAPYLTGGNASNFTVSVAPASSTLAAGATTSFVITFTPTAAGTRSATVNILNSDCSKPLFNFVIQGAAPAASALDFDGGNDYVALPTNTAMPTGNSPYTLEAKIKPDVHGTNAIIGWGNFGTNNQANALRLGSGIITNYWYFNDLTVNAPNLADGNWHHIAATYDGTFRKIYLDGVMMGQDQPTPPNVVGTANMRIGSSCPSCGGEYFDGGMDEVRVWNIARTQCQIQQYKDCEIPTTASGLVLNYHFNQGAAGLNNAAVTTLTDASASTITGTLTNMALTGTTSNWISPGSVANGYTTVAAPSTATLTVKGNGNTIAAGSVTTTTTNFTDFGGAGTRTFVTQNAPAGSTLYINSVTLSGANASDFSVTTVPTASAISGVGSGSFVITFSASAVGNRTAVVTVNSSDCTTPNYSFVITATTTAASGLNFDGNDDRIIAPAVSLNNRSFSVEFWAKRTSGSTNSNYVFGQGQSLGQHQSLHIGFRGTPGTNVFTFAFYSNDINYTTTAATDGNFHHWACVFDVTATGNNRFLYLDGVLVAKDHSNSSLQSVGQMVIGDGGPYFVGFPAPMDGTVDELRVWQKALTQCEIFTNMNCEIVSSPSLVANYHFNQGVPSGNNAGVTTLTDATGVNTGTLNGFGLNGSASNWISPTPIINNYTTTAPPAATLAVSGNAVIIAPGSVTTSTSDFTDFGGVSTRTFSAKNAATATSPLYVNNVLLSGASAADFSVTALPAASLAANATGNFVITFSPTAVGNRTAVVTVQSSDCTSPNYSFVITASVSAASALNLDGTNDYVSKAVFSAANNSVTMQARVFMTAATATNQVIVYNGNTSTSGYGLIASNTRQMEILFGGNTLLATGYTLPLNQWVALALVIENNDVRLYVNGLLTYTFISGLPAAPSGSFLIGADNFGTENFKGSVDEVLLWNKALTQCQIQTNIDSEIPGAAASLAANYHFNQGIPAGSNAAVTTVTDASGNNNTLTLTNFALTGSTSNWVSPGGVVNDYTTATTSFPEINIVGGSSVTINDDAITTSLADNTNFGSTCLNTGVTKTFTIQNTGSASLALNSLTVVGTDAALFAVNGTSTNITAGGSGTFAVTFSPTTSGIKNATVNIVSNDCDESLYDFAVTGSVSPTPTITVNSGSICQGGSFTMTPSGANTYTFTGGSAIVNPAVTTSYSVTGTSTAGCVVTSPAVSTVVVNPVPALTITASSVSVCSGATDILTASGAATYTWSNSLNSTTVSATSITINPTANVTYSVSGTSAGGCTASTLQAITVNPLPTITVPNGTICLGNSFTFNPGGASTYTYSGGSNVVTPGVTTTYSVIGTSAAGCVASGSVTATVSVINSITLSVTGNTTICEGTSATLTANGATTYSWSNGATTTVVVLSPTVNTTYTVYGASGTCSNTAVVSVSVNAAPTITVNGGTICSGQSFTLSPSGANTYNYLNGGPVVSPLSTLNFSVTGTSTAGCISTSPAVAQIFVNAIPPVAIAGSGTVCSGSSISFTASNATTYTWSTGDVGAVVTYTPSGTTTYTVTGAYPNGCSNTAVKTLSVITIPTVTVPNGTICAGQSFTINPSGASNYTYTGGGPVVSPTLTTTYSVSGSNAAGCTNTTSTSMTLTVNAVPTITVNGGTICSGQSFTLSPVGANTYTYLNGGPVVSPLSTLNYSVTGTSTAGCISTSPAVAQIFVNAIPPVAIAGSGTVCSGSSVSFTASNATTYTWSTGDVGAVVTYTPSGTTTYTVTGAYPNGCSNTTVKTLSVITIPTVTVPNGTICAGQSFTINPSGASNYTYTGGGPVVSPTLTTTYSVSGSNAAGCTNTTSTSMTLTVNAAPSVSVNSGAICSGSSFTMTPSGAVSYTYSSGSAVVNPASTTSYSVAGIDANGCVSTTSAISTVTVNALPTPTITASTASVCNGSSLSLTASGATSYTWSNSLNSTTISATSITITPTANVTYSASATNSNGCVGSAIQTLVVNALPTVTVPSGTICPGNSFTFNPSGASTYSYSSGSNIVTPGVTTTYSILGQSAAGCVASASVNATVSVINSITVSVTGNTLICNGQTASLTANGATTYSWSTGATTTLVALSPTVNTTYTVYGASGTCSNNAVVSVSVNAVPSVSVNSGAICSGSSFTMTPSGAVSYTYSSGSAVVNPASTTSYSVAGIDANGCVSTTSAISTITVNALPTPTITASTASVCNGSSLSLTASGATSYTWSNSLNSTTLSAASITITPTANVTYSASATNSNGCVGSAIQTLVVNALPTVTVPSGTICPGNSFTFNPSGASTYSYSSGSNIVTPGVTTTYSILGQSAAGCVASGSVTATVSVINSITVSVTGNTLICNGQTASLTANGATTYSWNTGATTTVLTVAPSANTTYTVYGASGTCSNSAVVSVSVNAVPTITVNSGAVCAGNSFTLIPGGAVTYTYSGGTAVVTPVNNSTYSVSGTDANNCVSTTSAISTVSINALPTPTITASTTSVCNGSSLSLTGSGATSYIWSNSLNSTTVSATSITITPTANVTYSASATNSNGCVGSAIQTLVVNALPTVTVPSGTICPGNSFTFNPSGASTYSYSSGSNIVTPGVTTTYSILGQSAAGCVASASVNATVSVINSITVSVTGNTLICNGQTASLTANGATTYSWNTGATTTVLTVAPSANTTYTVYGVSGTCSNNAVVSVSVNAVPTITVNSGAVCAGNSFTLIPGGALSYTYSSGSAIVNPLSNTTYSVAGANAAGCVSTASAISTVTVNALPALSIAASATSACVGSALTLTASGASTYTWSNSLNSTTISAASVTVTPAANVTYTALGVNASGCFGSATQLLSANPLPTITVPSGAVCPGGSFTFNPSGASTYSYSNGSNIVTPLATADYSIGGTSAAGCVASTSAVATVSVVSTLTISVTGNTTICSGSAASLTVGGASTYSWSTGVTTDSVTLSPAATTNYTVYGFSGSCVDKALVTVSVTSLPTITVNSGTVCAGNAFTLNPSGAATYSYSGGSAVVTPSANSDYSVTGTDANGCVSANAAIASLTVAASPALITSASPTVCAGSSASLSVSGAVTYSWSSAQTSPSIVVTPAASTVYTVSGTDAGGCSSTATLAAFVSPGATLNIVQEFSTVCQGSPVTLSVSGAESYTWSNGATSTSISVTPTTTTHYSVTGAASGSCNAAASAVINVHVLPVLNLSASDTLICTNTTVNITASGAVSYAWSTGQIASTITPTLSADATFTVTGINTNICSNSAQITITVQKCNDPVEPFSGITLNNDGINDIWIIKNITEYPKNKVSVFNRWGVEVGSIIGYDNDTNVWPLNGEKSKLTSGTYFYIIELNDGSKAIKGWLEIIKD